MNIKRTVTKFAVSAAKIGVDKKGNFIAQIIANFEYVGGTKPNAQAARKAYFAQYGKDLPRGCKLSFSPVSREVWGMDSAEFMKYAHKLSDKEIEAADDEGEDE